MRKVSAKIIIAVLLVMMVACSAMAALSFALADEENGAAASGAVASQSVNKKIIDYIIDYSYGSDAYEATDTTGMSNSEKALVSETDPLLDESVYHIVEIGSSSKVSDLAKLAGVKDYESFSPATSVTTFNSLVAADGTFKTLVIDGHRSYYEGKTNPESYMKDGKVSYTYIDNTQVVSDIDKFYAVRAINKADLVYVSMDNSSISKLYNKNNDLCEEIKIALSAYATGDFKPLIIDSYSKTVETIGRDKNFGSLASDVFAKTGSSYSTYSWPTNDDILKFMSRTDAQDFYLPIRGDQFSAKWTELFETDAAAVDPAVPDSGKTTTGKYMAKVLVISSGSTSTIGAKFLEGIGGTGATAYTNDKVTDVDLTNTFVVPEDSTLYKKGYYSRWAHPDLVKFDILDASSADQLAKLEGGIQSSTSVAGSTDPLADFSLDNYDFILIDQSVKSIALSNEAYAGLQGAMMAGTCILYDTGVIGAGSTAATAVSDASNFNYVYDKVATSTDMPRTNNILVTTRSKMSAYAIGIAPVAVDDIANIINGGTFRGISGNASGSSSTVYTVLEIEPCYPIDTELAMAFTNGNLGNISDPNTKKVYAGGTKTSNAKDFYSVTASRLWKGHTDPGMYYIRTGDVLSVTADEISYDGITALSVEKSNGYSALTNAYFSENAANISDYYAWKLSKAKIAHATGKAYDEVNVIHMSSKEFNASKDTLLDNYDAVYIGGDYSSVMSAQYWASYALNGDATGIYMMYRHDGDIFNYSNRYYNASEAYGVFLGNDISSDKLTELTTYMEAGMPIIIDQNLSTAYEHIADANQILIDPQSNMANFLKKVNARAGSNVVWGFDSDKTVMIANPNNMYGNTIGGVVTVFGGVEEYDYLDNQITPDGDEARFSALLRSKERPKLYVTKNPMKYTEGDSSTWITNHKLEYEFEVNSNISKNAKVTLYIDDNSDSKFDEVGEATESVSASAGKLSVTIPENYFGVVYWKLEVKDGNCAASTTGACKIARTTQEKMKINLIQLMPEMPAHDASEATLYLCTECQQSRIILYGNRSVPNGQYKNTAEQVLSLSSRARDFSKPADIDGSTLETNLANTLLTTVDKNYSYSDLYATYFGPATNGLNSGRGAYNTLGVHEHDFGIVKYYEDGTIPNNSSYIGLDDWNTNWFDEVKEDYDVDLTILSIGEFNKIVESVNAAYAGKTAEEIVDIQDAYAQDATKYLQCYEAMRAIINQQVELMVVDGTKLIKGDIALSYNATSSTVSTKITVDATQAGYQANKTKADAQASMKESEINANIQVLFAELVKYLNLDTAHISNYRTYYGITATDMTGLSNEQVVGLVAYRMLNTFLHSSEKIDDYLLDNKTALINSDVKSAELEIGIYTDPDIERDKRQYYDFFSLAGKGSNNIKITINGTQHYPFEDMAELYIDYRDAKTIEQYFKEMSKIKTWYASINTDSTVAAASQSSMANMSATPLNKIDLSASIDCIAVGAAQNFGINHSYSTEKDITEAGCNALLDYIYDGGDVILFHSSLTAEKGLTDTMTAMLGDEFGQNARHMMVDTSGQTTMQFDNVVTVNLGAYSDSFTMTSDMTGMVVNAKEKASTKQENASLTFTYGGGKTYTLPANTPNNVPGYTFDITASVSSGSGLTVSMKDIADTKTSGGTFMYSNAYNTGDSYTITINNTGYTVKNGDVISIPDGYVGSDGKIHVTFTGTNGYSKSYTYDATVTSMSFERHIPNVIYDWGQQLQTWSSDYTVSTNSKSYNLVANRTSGVLADMGTQEYVITFTDGTNPIANETVTYTLDGETETVKSGADGKVIIYRKNYEVTGYDIDIASAGANSTGADIDQLISVNVTDMDGNPVNGTKVKLDIKPGTDAAVSTTLTTVDGLASYSTKNWKVRPTDTRSFVVNSAYAADTNEKYGTKKYYMNLGTANGRAVNPQLLSISAVGATKNQSEYALPYKYTSYNLQITGNTGTENLCHGGNDVRGFIYSNGDYVETDRATKTNDGIVTSYPFTIGDRLQISPTEQNDFAVDIEDSDVTVYYALSGGAVGTSSSMFAADPNNGTENYFIYQKNTHGTITYIGAGHCCITGLGRNNNDERRLFINIILNSGRLSTKKLSLNLYDHESKIDSTTSVLTNKKVKINEVDETGEDYIYSISDITDAVEFAFLPSTDASSKVSNVTIYFDLTYDPATALGKHEYGTGDVLVYSKATAVENSLNYIDLPATDNAYQWTNDSTGSVKTLKLQENYFIGSGELQQRYAYLVVRVTDTSGNVVTKTIRIQFKPELHHET